jgi:hypothetical protein
MTREEQTAALRHVREQMALLTDPDERVESSERTDLRMRVMILADAVDAVAAALLELLAASSE